MRIYLDNCSLQRPLDNKTQVRISLEAEAILGFLVLLEAGQVELISSEALLFEISRNPHRTRCEYAVEVLSLARTTVILNEKIKVRANELNSIGLDPLDALHLASAEGALADYFCTCDDKLLKKARGLEDINTKVVNPIELIEEIER